MSVKLLVAGMALSSPNWSLPQHTGVPPACSAQTFRAAGVDRHEIGARISIGAGDFTGLIGAPASDSARIAQDAGRVRAGLRPETAVGIKEFYRQQAISADAVARAIAYAIEQPADVDINEVLLRPTIQEL